MKYRVIYMNLPTTEIKGACCILDESKPAEYTIVINCNMPTEVQTETLKHELKHIELNHHNRILNGEITVAQAEVEVHSSKIVT